MPLRQNTLARKPFPLRSRPSMTPDNQADAGKSRRGPGRRFSRLGWRPLLFRVSRYFKDSTGGAAGRGLWKRYSTLFPCGEPRGGGQSPLLMLAGAGAAETVFRRDSVYLGFLGKAGREGAEVLCGRVWRQKTCNWHIIRVTGPVGRLCGLRGRLRAFACGRRASVGVSGARQRG